MNYFIWNNEEDFKEGFSKGVEAHSRYLKLSDESSQLPGYYVSEVFDSGEAKTIWSRMLITLELGENMAVETVIYGTESRETAFNFINQLKEEQPDREYAQHAMAPCLKMTLHNPKDVLLYSVSARYLWFSLTLFGNGCSGPKVSYIQLWFPKESWISFLPEYYQTHSGDFLERYLAVFETLYREVEQDIRKNTRSLDIQSVPEEQLAWLVGWLDMENIQLWPADKLRRYLEDGAASYAYRGTKRGLERMVWIYTGEKPFIVESGGEAFPYECYLYISQKSVPTLGDYNALLQIIREGKPAHMEVRVCVLRPYLFLNQDSYIGINSVLSNYRIGVLDGNAMIPLAVLGGNKT